MGKNINSKYLGWIQCTQCGNGFEVTKQEVDCGDYKDRQSCDHCGIGPMRIDWDYPDGPGWKYSEINNLEKLLDECIDCLESQFDPQDNIIMVEKIKKFLNEELKKYTVKD